MTEHLKWEDDCAHTRFGRYMVNKSRIRHGTEFQTEYEVYLDAKLIGIGDNKAAGKSIAQGHFNLRSKKESQET